MKPLFISTAIPYVNAEPHIGFALELVQADAAARYWRAQGRDVFFVTGTDENSLKNVRAAQAIKMPTADFVAQHADKFKSLISSLSLSCDDFIRTTELRHIAGAQKLWKLCEKDIYKKKYRGLYCVGCEQFYKESELTDGLCPEHKTRPEEVEEENYFFRLSHYQKQMEDMLTRGDAVIIPDHRKNEMLSFIRSGLEDFSISRSRERAGNWGIPVPGDENQIMYVWFDALTNYINALGFADDAPDFKKFWAEGEVVHTIGKGITRFHAIYWPAMLLSAQLPLPKKIVVHGYVTASGEKMSKSIGNVVSPSSLVEEWGADAVRYFLLREIPSFEDGDYSSARFSERYAGDLAHGLGNLVSRSLTLMARKGRVEIFEGNALKKEIEYCRTVYDEACTSFRFGAALEALWGLITAADRYINETKPWELIKNDEVAFTRVASSLWLTLWFISEKIKPFMPATGEIIGRALVGNNGSVPANMLGEVIAGLERPPNLFPLKESEKK